MTITATLCFLWVLPVWNAPTSRPTAPSKPTTSATSQRAHKGHSQLQIAYIRLPRSAFRPSIEPLSQTAMASWMRTHREKLRAYYKAHLDEFLGEKRVRARHILFRTSPRDSAERRRAILARAQKLHQLVKKYPRHFAAFAHRFSEGPSRVKGGDLSYFTFSSMTPPFAKAAFALRKKGDISPIVQTRFGYHIIQLVDTRPATHIPFASARLTIAPRLWLQQQRDKRLDRIVRWFATQWQKAPQSDNFLQLMATHFRTPSKVANTTNGVIHYWKRFKSQIKVGAASLPRTTPTGSSPTTQPSRAQKAPSSSRRKGAIPGIPESTQKLIQALRQHAARAPGKLVYRWYPDAVYIIRIVRR